MFLNFLIINIFYSVISSSWYFPILSSGIITADGKLRKLRETWFVICCIDYSVIFHILAVVRTSSLNSRRLWTSTTVIKSKIRLGDITFTFKFLLRWIHVLVIACFMRMRDIILVLSFILFFIIFLLFLILLIFIVFLTLLFLSILISLLFIILLLIHLLIGTILILLESLLKILLINSILVSQSVSFNFRFYLTFHFFLNMVDS